MKSQTIAEHGAATTDYLLCGWRVRSQLPLPELPAWTAGPGEADIFVRAGRPPERFENGCFSGSQVMVGPDGDVLLEIPLLLRMLVRGGAEIVIEILGDAADPGWRLFLLGSGLGYLCHQRRLLPLHAACLRVNGRALAIAGPSGAGKSTLSLALVQRGATLLSDDVSVLRVVAGAPRLLPAYPRLKLWPDSLTAQGVALDGLARVRAGLEKFDLRSEAETDFDPEPCALDAVIVLAEGEQRRLEPLPTLQSVAHLRENIFRAQVARAMGRANELFAQIAGFAAATPVYLFERPKNFATLTEDAALILDRLAS